MTDELFDWSGCAKKLPSGSVVRTKKSIEYRKKIRTREVKRVDQVITEFLIDVENDTVEIYYYMAGDQSLTIQPPYRVPRDQFKFIQEAIDEGVLTPNKPLWIDIEVDGNNRNVWLRIEEK